MTNTEEAIIPFSTPLLTLNHAKAYHVLLGTLSGRLKAAEYQITTQHNAPNIALTNALHDCYQTLQPLLHQQTVYKRSVIAAQDQLLHLYHTLLSFSEHQLPREHS